MSTAVDKMKQLVAAIMAFYERIRARYRIIDRVLATLERYGQRRGGTYASAIAYRGILALVPVLMVSFSIAGFVLASRPEWIETIINTIVNDLPGELGESVGSIITSAVDSRGAVGLIGLVSAALTGIGWIGLVRNALTDMWGGRLETNAVLAKLKDLAMFVVLGLVFLLTIALTVLANGPIAHQVTDWLGLGDLSTLLRWVSQLVAVLGTWWLFIVMLAKLPRHKLPLTVVVWPALATALAFTALKELGGLYLRSVMSSPAGVAFGPILGIMAFAYLASQIVLYATAWIASNPKNEPFRVIDYTVADLVEDREPAVLAPVYVEHQTPSARALLTAAGIGAAVTGAVSWLRRDR